MICRTATCASLVVFNTGCVLESFTKILRIPLSGSHLKSIKAEFLGGGAWELIFGSVAPWVILLRE